MKVTIPTPLVDIIYRTINVHETFSDFPESIKEKIFTKCIELWFFIFDEQSTDKQKKEKDIYSTQIKRIDLDSFYIKYENIKYGYRKLIEILIESNILDVNDMYEHLNVKGKNFCKKYRILYNFTTNNKTTEIEIDTKKIFSNIKDKSYWLALYPQHAHLIEDVYKTKINLNYIPIKA